MQPNNRKRSAFEIRLDAEAERELTDFLSDEIITAFDSRQALIGEDAQIDYFHELYKQGRTRTAKNSPWPDSADLTSYIGTEKVDALRARLVRTIFSEPVWVVEGWGKAAQRAPMVEEFHQWKVEEERLQSTLGKVLHNALIEGTGVLEVTERADRRKTLTTQKVALQTLEDGSVLFDENAKPVLKRDPAGAFVPAQGDEPSADAVIQDAPLVHKGPKYRVLSVKDFLILPGHAADKEDIWGYAKRFWARVPTLKQREKDGIYRNVDRLGDEGERQDTNSLTRDGQQIAQQKGATAEKELWEVYVLRDLDGDGIEEWYIATLSVSKRVLLRIQRDDLGVPRHVLFTPFPKATSVWGHSFLGDKLWTLIEEHTAERNMIADRSTLVVNAPMKRLQGALWDPFEQPFGPRQVIDVRDMREIEPMQIPDVPASMIDRERSTLNASERVAGMADMMSGVQAATQRTLGENQMVMEQSFIRVEESVKYIQESMEELGQIRNLLWIRALKDEPQGIEAPSVVLENLSYRGLTLDNERFSADLLMGPFRFKPRGSVDSADPSKMRADFNQFLSGLAGLSQSVPIIGQWLNSPDVVKSLMEQFVRLYRLPNRQALLGGLTQAFQQQAESTATWTAWGMRANGRTRQP